MDSLNNFSSSLLYVFDFISSEHSNLIPDDIQNTYKINRLILDVLSPLIRNWIENYIRNTLSLEISQFFNQYNGKIQDKKYTRELGSVRRKINEFKQNNPSSSFPNNLDNFDTTACSSLVMNIINKTNMKQQYLDDYNQIKITKDFNEFEAINYSRIIRNHFYGHTKSFSIKKSEFDEVVEKLEKIFLKLNLNQNLKSSKDFILNNQIKIENKNEEFNKWLQESKKFNKESNQIFDCANDNVIPDKTNLTINTKNITLFTIFVKECLEQSSRNYLIFSIDDFVNRNEIVDKFVRSEHGKKFQTLCIYCHENETLNSELKEIFLFKKYNRSIIVIGIDKINSFEQFYFKTNLSFSNLNEEKQRYYLKNSKISFQNRDLSLNHMIDFNDSVNKDIQDIFDSIREDQLELLFQNKILNILKENEGNSLVFDEIEKYYIKRTFQRFVYFDAKILNDREILKENEFAFSLKEFNEKCKLNYRISSTNMNIHFVEKHSNEDLKWIKTKGNISILDKYSKRDKIIEISETDLIDLIKKDSTLNEKLMIICDDPGMGKTVITKRIAYNLMKNNKENYFFIYLTLNNFKKEFDDLKKQSNNKNYFRIICKKFLKFNDLQFNLFKHLANSNRLFIIFDGLDEIIQFKDEIIEIIRNLLENFSLKKIILTTRNHLKNELQDIFGMISYNLIGFTRQNQIDFLYNYWINNIQQMIRIETQKVKNFVILLINKVDKMSNSIINTFIEIPLKLRMIADIYKDKIYSQITVKEERIESAKLFNELNNLSDFYINFIDAKFEEKYKLKDKMSDEYSSDIKKKFMRDHINYSFILMFNKSLLEIDYNEEEKLKIINYGIILKIQDNKPNFLHQSYAEFFIAKFLTDGAKNSDNLKDTVIKILNEENYFLIRKFVDGMLEKNNDVNNICFKEKIDIKKISILNTVKENLKNLLKYLLNIDCVYLNEIDIDGRNALHLAAYTGNKEIAELLINKFIDNKIYLNEKDKYGNNALHLAFEKEHIEIVELLIKNDVCLNEKNKAGNNALHLASERGYKEIVELLIKKGIDVNEKNLKNRNALHFASKEGHKEIVELIINNFVAENKIDLNQKDLYGKNALHLASENGHKQIVELLIKKDIDVNEINRNGENALHLASSNGHKEIVEMLIDKGINLNEKNEDGENALHLAIKTHHIEIVELLINKKINLNAKNKDGRNALHLAYEADHKEIVENLVEKGININEIDKKGRNALHLAYEHGHAQIVQTLINKGINIEQKDSDGLNSLHLACENGQKEIVNLLINKGIDLHVKYTKKQIFYPYKIIEGTALHLASKNGHKEILELLIENGMSLDEKDSNGFNALLTACSTRKNNKEIVEFIINKGVDLNEKNINGENALHLASSNGHKEIVEMLIDKGIDVNEIKRIKLL